MKNNIKIGIIGGSGMEDPAFISNYKSKNISTPYGDPSSVLIIGKIANFPIVIISRHGSEHSINPSNVNYQANIWALKEEGCTHILAITACGSLRKRIEPGDFVFPDQFIDFTKNRLNTFYSSDKVQHTPMGKPFDFEMRSCLSEISEDLGYKHHNSGTVITIEGPRFSTKAESLLFKSWGSDIINMSTCPEVILANELNLKYQSIAMSTDYDCWHESEEEVSMEIIYSVMSKNVSNVKKLINIFVESINRKSI